MLTTLRKPPAKHDTIHTCLHISEQGSSTTQLSGHHNPVNRNAQYFPRVQAEVAHLQATSLLPTAGPPPMPDAPMDPPTTAPVPPETDPPPVQPSEAPVADQAGPSQASEPLPAPTALRPPSRASTPNQRPMSPQLALDQVRRSSLVVCVSHLSKSSVGKVGWHCQYESSIAFSSKLS